MNGRCVVVVMDPEKRGRGPEAPSLKSCSSAPYGQNAPVGWSQREIQGLRGVWSTTNAWPTGKGAPATGEQATR